MENVIKVLTYTNWARIDDEHKKGNRKPSLMLEYDDFYLADDFIGVSKNDKVYPFLTMFRTQDMAKDKVCEYNLVEGAYDYFFVGQVTSGVAADALRKCLRSKRVYGKLALYINTVSTDNLLFEANISLLERM